MAIKQQIVIEVDDKGAVKSVDNLTDAINENTDALEDNADAQDDAGDAAEKYSKSLEQQEARIKVLDGAINLIGGTLETVTGALVLSGAVTEESAEKFESAALGAIALADGTKRTLDGVKSLSEGLKAYGGVAGIAQKAQAALNTTILANPYVAAAVAIAALGVAIYAFTREVDEAAEFQKEFDAAMADATGTVVAQTQAIETYNGIVQDSTRPLEERQYALEELNKQGVATEDIDLANAESLQLLNERTAQAIPLIMARAKASAAAQILEEALKTQLQEQNKSLEDNISWLDETIAAVTSFGNAYAFQFRRIERGAKNWSEATQKANEDVARAQTAYQETLDELIKLEGENITVQETVRKNLERRAKTDESVKQALIDRANAEQKAIDIYKDVQNQIEILRAEGFEKEKIAIEQSYEEKLELLTIQYGAESQQVKELLELRNAEIAAAQADFDQKQKDEAQKAIDDRLAAVDASYAKQLEDFEAFSSLRLTDEMSATERAIEMKAIAQEREILNTQAYYGRLIAIAKENGQSTEELEKAQAAAINNIKRTAEEEDVVATQQYRNQLQDLALNSAQSLISDLSALNQLFDQDNEEQARKAFNREKALASVETVISTYSAAQKAYASQLSIPTPDAPVRAQIAAGVAIVSGLAKLAVINAQQFKESGTASAAGGGGGGAVAAANPVTFTAPGQSTAPTTTTPTPTPTEVTPPVLASSNEPLRAYVLSGDVSNGLQADARIKTRRKL
jgi:hypothetical protein